MKKRLLSAALALAMVLTMLPLSAFASYDSPDSSDIKGDGTQTVKYVSSRDSTHDKVGWYVTVQYPAVAATDSAPAKPAKSVDIYLENPTGLSVAGMYYAPEKATFSGNASYDADSKVLTNTSIYSATYNATEGKVVQGNLKGNVIVIGGDVAIDAVNATSLSLDVYGGTATINGSNLTSVTVTNSQYATYGKGTVKLGSGVASQLTSLALNHVTYGDNTLEMNQNTTSGAAHSITLNDVTGGTAITMTGTYTTAAGVASSSAQTVSITKSTIGNLTVTGNGSRVNLNEMPATGTSTVSITGTGSTFGFQGGGQIGDLTITGSSTGNEVTTAPSSVTIAAGCTVGNINSSLNDFSNEKATGRNTVSISGTAGSINFRNAAVSVTGGTVGAITMDTGTVTVSGNRATVGNVTLSHDATFTLSGTNCKIGALAVATGGNAASVTFTVPNEPSNTLGTNSASVDGYTKQTISGGTWLYAVPASMLSTSLAYQLKTDDSYTYYTSSQLGEAIVKQGSIQGSKLTKIGDASASAEVTFMNGSITWGVLSVSPDVSIELPTQVNSVNTPYWTDGKFTNLAGTYNVPSAGATLNAGGGAVTNEVTALTNVEVNGNTSDIKATLVGNVITLTGAVNPGDTKFTLTLETDAVKADKDDPSKEVSIEIEVGVIFDPSKKTLTFANPGSQSLDYGVVIENTFNAIKLGNGTRYTLNGQGLVVRNQSIKVKGIDTSGYPSTVYSENDIEVIVSAPNFTANDTLKQQVIDLINGENAEFKWTDSPAAKRAVNAALATITDANVESYRQAARSRAWSDNGIRGQSLTTATPTAYNNGTVCLVPYLEVNVTSWLPSTTNASLTATLTMKWRVEVHPEANSKDPQVNDAANIAKNGVYIAKTGTALTLDSDLGEGVSITFDTGVSSATFAHQANTYDYEIDKGVITVTHAVNGNLGQFVLDSNTPLVVLGAQKAGETTPIAPLQYFSTLQAAVDAAEDGQLIEVNSAYKGSMSINMTGKARTIYIQANGKNVVVANASGGLVTENSTGSYYTIKLNRDNNVASTATTATISVAGAANGYARTNVSSAQAGSTVTITSTANTGYMASAPTVRWNSATASNQSVGVASSGANTWTFVVPTGATSVTVTPNFVVSDGRIFPDVEPTAWYASSVAYCYNTMKNGYRLMEGNANGTFTPTSMLDRAQMVQILYNLAGRPAVTGTCPFPDVVGGQYNWAAAPITWAAQQGYVIGYTDGKFHPEVNVSRQDMVLILYRYAKQPPIGTTSSLAGYYDGGNVGSWATNAVRWAANMGILSGTSSVSLNGYIYGPTKARRCEVAVTIANFYRLYG